MLLQHSLLVREGSVFGQIPSSTRSITADVWSFSLLCYFSILGQRDLFITNKTSIKEKICM